MSKKYLKISMLICSALFFNAATIGCGKTGDHNDSEAIHDDHDHDGHDHEHEGHDHDSEDYDHDNADSEKSH